jgi:hypothetical protein
VSTLRAWRWTTLPPLELRGLGTPEAESLESYVVRLAHASGETVASLLQKIDATSGEKYVHNNRPRSLITGPGKRRFIHRAVTLNTLTGNTNLLRGTFWALNKLIHVTGHGLSHNRRWCPACLQVEPDEWVGCRLVWHFSHVSRCSIHNVAIEGTCPNCGSVQRSVPSFSSYSKCSSCRKPLGHAGQFGLPQTLSQEWVDRNIGELVAWISSDAAFELPGNTYRRFKDQFSHDPGLMQQLHELGTPTVAVLLNVAAAQGVSVLDVLLRPEEVAAPPLIDLRTDFTGIPFSADWENAAVARARHVITTLLTRRCELPPIGLLLERYEVERVAARWHMPYLLRRYGHYYDRQAKFLRTRAKIRAFSKAIHLLQKRQKRRAVYSAVAQDARLSRRDATRIVNATALVLVAEHVYLDT